MKMLGICASPRRGGNSDVLIDECLKYAGRKGVETGKIFLPDMDIAPCAEEEYFKADDKGYPVIKDDMEKVLSEVEKADILVVASPIFFGSVSAQLKIMIDRFQSVWVAKNIFKKDIFRTPKKAAFICVSASDRNDFFENANFVVRNFFATVGARCDDTLFVPGVENKGDVANNKDVLSKARDISKSLIDKYKRKES